MEIKGSFYIKTKVLSNKEYNVLPGYECLNCRAICKFDKLDTIKFIKQKTINGCYACGGHNLRIIKGKLK